MRRGGSTDRGAEPFRDCGCRQSGRAASTRSNAPSLRRKSGVSTSTVIAGDASRNAVMTREKWSAPPSLRSSRSTEVTTICVSPSSLAAAATRAGSCGSSGRGRPVRTLQKAQARVHVSPMIMNVAWRLLQHSPMLGQPASSHTVVRPWLRTMRTVSACAADPGARTRIHDGLAGRGRAAPASAATGVASDVAGALNSQSSSLSYSHCRAPRPRRKSALLPPG